MCRRNPKHTHTHTFIKDYKMTKTPYEVRLELLKLSKEAAAGLKRIVL